MHIYPYVYRLTHKKTGQIYIGLRFANKVKSTDDIWVSYFSSSKTVKHLGVENFSAEVIAEFFDKHDAQLFEAQEIKQLWGNPLLLNKCIGGKHFACFEHSLETRQKMSLAHKGKIISDATKVRMGNASRGRRHSTATKELISQLGKNFSTATREKMKVSHLGKTFSDETKQRMRASHLKRRTLVDQCSESHT